MPPNNSLQPTPPSAAWLSSVPLGALCTPSVRRYQMCDCSILPSRWWPEQGSDAEAERRNWRHLIRGAFGWADLWQCRDCRQYWEAYITCGTPGSDCLAKWYGSQEEWSTKTQTDYDRYIREERLEKKAQQIKREMEREGYSDIGYFALYSPWDDLVPWKAIIAGKKRGLFSGGEEKQIVLILARNGDICPIDDAQLAIQLAIGHTIARRIW